MFFHDRATISGKARITREGYFVADALVAKANNIQYYRAVELGLTDRDPGQVVRVFRPEAAVFAVDTIKSASRLPITLDHPPTLVDASNWREYAKGETGEEIMRDGEFMRVPIRVTDAGAVGSVQRDRQEFSLGYEAKLDFTPGVYDGQDYDAKLTDIRYNHLAACKLARGGAELRITDERVTPPQEGVQPVNAIMVDGFSVNLTDATATGAAIAKLVAERDALKIDISAKDEAAVKATAELATATAKVTELTDALAKAKPTTAELRDAAAKLAKTIADAKRFDGVTIADDMDADAAMRAVVNAKLGDAAKDYSDDHVAIAFDTLVSGLPAAGQAPPTPAADPLRTAIGDAQTGVVVDAKGAFAKARSARFNRLHNAHKGPTAKEA